MDEILSNCKCRTLPIPAAFVDCLSITFIIKDLGVKMDKTDLIIASFNWHQKWDVDNAKARGIGQNLIIDSVQLGGMELVTDWILEADQVLVF